MPVGEPVEEGLEPAGRFRHVEEFGPAEAVDLVTGLRGRGLPARRRCGRP